MLRNKVTEDLSMDKVKPTSIRFMVSLIFISSTFR